MGPAEALLIFEREKQSTSRWIQSSYFSATPSQVMQSLSHWESLSYYKSLESELDLNSGIYKYKAKSIHFIFTCACKHLAHFITANWFFSLMYLYWILLLIFILAKETKSSYLLLKFQNVFSLKDTKVTENTHEIWVVSRRFYWSRGAIQKLGMQVMVSTLRQLVVLWTWI